MEVGKITLSFDMKLPKENLRNACKMLMYRLPRKHKKRWKASIAKQLRVKPSQIRLQKEVAWEYIKSVEEDIENINKGLNTFVF